MLLCLDDGAVGDSLREIQGSLDQEAEYAIEVDMLHSIFSRVIVQG